MHISGLRSLFLLGLFSFSVALSPRVTADTFLKRQVLDVIPTFVLVDSESFPLVTHNNSSCSIKAYLDEMVVNDALVDVSRSIRDVRVQALPLGVLYDKVNQINASLNPQGQACRVILIPRESDLSDAGLILMGQGFSEKSFYERITLPVFYTDPFTIILHDNAYYLAFFSTRQDMHRVIDGMPAGQRPKPMVADIEAVFRVMDKNPSAKYILVPPPSYYTLVKSQGQEGPQFVYHPASVR